MLVIDVVLDESYDETTEKFVASRTARLELEHSLVALSKWEQIWEKPFLSQQQRTDEETVSYVEAMIVGEKPSPEIFYKLLSGHMKEIIDYISAKMTGTHFSKQPENNARRETITAERIYYWMAKMGIPMECQHWHLNRLFSLIKTHAVLETPRQKMTLEQRRALNKQRQKEWNTKG